MSNYERHIDTERLWVTILAEARQIAESTPLLFDFYSRYILNHDCFERSLGFILAEKLADKPEQIEQWQSFIFSIMKESQTISESAMKDLLCQLRNNASIKDHYTPLVYFAGYQALQCYRLANYCWVTNQRAMASYIQAKVVSQYAVDIHPAAVIGDGIFIDHAAGIVIGETAVVEDEVTLFQGVTLGGTGKDDGDRHPKVRKGAFIGAGAVVFGNIEIGPRAKVAGGAVVVKNVPADTTMLGPLAKPLQRKQ